MTLICIKVKYLCFFILQIKIYYATWLKLREISVSVTEIAQLSTLTKSHSIILFEMLPYTLG